MTTGPIVRNSASRALPSGALAKQVKASYYEAILNILGSTGVIIPLHDPDHQAADNLTVPTIGDEAATFTYSKDVTTWDVPPTFRGITPVLTFDGVDEQADTPDAAFWSRDDGSNEAMSLGVWINPSDITSVELFAKWAATDYEWIFRTPSSGKLRFQTWDTANGVGTIRESNVALTADVWQFLVVTYDGSGGATAGNGMTLYVNGAVRASTATNNGSYVKMVNGTEKPTIGTNSDSASGFYTGAMAGGPFGPFFVGAELTADAIKRLYEQGVYAGLAE